MKRNSLIYVVYFLGITVGGYFLTIHYLPNGIFQVFKKRSQQRGILENKTTILAAPDETARAVVLPNPDFTYVSCFYDLQDGPLQLTGNLPDSTYWSVAFYQPNTVNFYVKNDQQYGTNKIDLVLSAEKLKSSEREVVVSPTQKGFMLIRVLVTDKSAEFQEKTNQMLQTIQIKNLVKF